jgi:hypothetical protein
MPDITASQHYRERAAEMLARAHAAPTEMLKNAYRILAADWARLAQQQGLARITPGVMPGQD